MPARPSPVKAIPLPEAKAEVLRLIAQGAKVIEAMAAVGRKPETYKSWLADDLAFKQQMAALRASRAAVKQGKSHIPDFDVFCDKYLHEPLFPHQYNMWDAIEGRRPRFLDPAMVYEPGESSRVIVNIPPSHSKTVTFSMNYVTWLIHKNPGISIAIVSKSQGFAKKILGGVKARLTDKNYRDMHMRFGPDGGWQDPDAPWNQNMIYVTGKYDGETEKDPTVEAVGMEGQIYGGRFDVIILDDVVDNTNAHRFEDQADWTMTILDSRLPPDGGLMLVLGTRLAPADMYAALRSKQDENEDQFFSYLSMPAVLEYAERREDWRTLWPWQLGSAEGHDSERRCMRCYAPEGAPCCDKQDVRWLRPRWNGPRLAKKRYPLGQRRWSLVWMQQQIPDDATFAQQTVNTSINRMRQPGIMRPGQMGHRNNGMEGLYVVGGLDPATVGKTAMMIGGVDRITGKRWMLDGFNQAGTSPATMRKTVKDFTDKYKINEWVIEKNAFQKFLTEDPELKSFLQSRGCKLTAHYTTSNKTDADFGVMSMAPLFESTGMPPRLNGGGAYKRVAEGDLIELPDERQSAWVSEYVAQLVAWEPQGMSQRQKTDLVMASWFPLDIDTPLWTTAGWKTMGTVAVGDHVATASGEMASVAALTPIEKQPVYRVGMSDGTSLRATGNHRWWVEPVAKGGPTLPQRWMTTDEIRTSQDFKRICIRNPEPIDGPDIALPVDPYVLGCWLGDGDAQQGTIYGHPDDTPFVRVQFELAGYPTTDQKRQMCFGTSGLRHDLAIAGVLGNKHVPEAYLHGSLKQRLGLLQGLMDTDGSVLTRRGRSYFSNTNKNLVDAVQLLALSLGFRVDIQHYDPAFGNRPNGRSGMNQENWRVLFTADSGTLDPFRMPRKADRVDAYVNTKPHRRLVIKSIVPDGVADVRCITVDHSSHVFLAGRDLIPTGNCEIAFKRILNRGKSVVTHATNPFASRGRVKDRMVVNIADWRAAQLAEKEAA